MLKNKSKYLDIVKHSMFAVRPDNSCQTCNKPYCCRGQQYIQIAELEFNEIKSLIRQVHIDRAKIEIEKNKDTYNCPFNNPVTGECDIYDNRFIVCASYGVVNPSEQCNTESTEGDGGTLAINPKETFSRITDKETIEYLMYLGKSQPTDILEEFKKLV